MHFDNNLSLSLRTVTWTESPSENILPTVSGILGDRHILCIHPIFIDSFTIHSLSRRLLTISQKSAVRELRPSTVSCLSHGEIQPICIQGSNTLVLVQFAALRSVVACPGARRRKRSMNAHTLLLHPLKILYPLNWHQCHPWLPLGPLRSKGLFTRDLAALLPDAWSRKNSFSSLRTSPRRNRSPVNMKANRTKRVVPNQKDDSHDGYRGGGKESDVKRYFVGSTVALAEAGE